MLILLYYFFTDAQEYAREIGAVFCETSAMTAVNVAELFDAIGMLNVFDWCSVKNSLLLIS